MKIGDRRTYSVGPLGPVSVPAPGAASEPEGPSAASGDQLEISSSSREIGVLKAALATVPEMRMEKIETIRESVEDGSYYVESEKIAKRVVDEALQDAVRRGRD